ncbi:MAG: hypothetical protein H3C38_05155 [Rhodospirillales bacterium]|nr:hypothetical protein [Rhodospirillales bacterium]
MKRKSLLSVAAAVTILAASNPAAAEPLSVAEYEYQPMTYAGHGRLEACGVRFLVVTHQRMAFDGSVNVFLIGSSNLTMVFKIIARSGDEALKAVPISFAWMRLRNGSNTLDFKRIPGEIPEAYVAYSTAGDSKEIRLLFDLVASGAVVGVSEEGKESDHTFDIPPAAERVVFDRLFECTDQLVDQALSAAQGHQ